MNKPRKEKTISFLLFGFFGVNITDDTRKDGDDWLFGDADFRTNGVIQRFDTQSNKVKDCFNIPELKEKWGEQNWIEAMKDFADIPVQACIVIRRERSHWLTSESFQHQDQMDRAAEISALLSCVLFNEPGTGAPFATGMRGEIFHWAHKIVEIHQTNTPVINYFEQSQPPSALKSSKPISMTFESLYERLFNEEYGVITPFFMSNAEEYHHKFAKVLRAAAELIAAAIRSHSTTNQLLGAYTAIEMLVGSHKSEKVLHRLKALIGIEEFQAYRAESVVKARDNAVHNGIIPSDIKGLQAVSLALDALLNVSSLLHYFEQKEQLMAFLDFRGTQELLSQGLRDFLSNPAISSERVNLRFKYARDKE